MSVVVLLFFMFRGGIFPNLKKGLSCNCGRTRYRPLAMEELGQLEMARLSAADTQELDGDEDETIFDANTKYR